MRRKSMPSLPNIKVAKVPRQKREARYGLRDMFVNRPSADAGLVMSLVWGNSEAEFDEIVRREAEDRQRRSLDRFTNKIKPRTSGKSRRRR